MMFSLTLTSPRWGFNDTWKFTWTDEGWIMDDPQSPSDSYAVPKDGGDKFLSTLQHDDYRFPYHTSGALERLWHKADEGCSPDEIQEAFDVLAEWIQECDRVHPNTGLFEGW